MPRQPIATSKYRTGMFDFSAGVVASLASFKLRPRHARRANNVLFRPKRAFTVRSGSRNLTSAAFAADEVPHSLGRFYHATSPRLFAGTDDGATRRIREVLAASIVTQSLPFTPSAELWSFDMIGAALVAAQRAGSEKPIFYEASNPANTWYSIVLPTPGNSLTIADSATAGDLVAGTQYRWRLRWRHRNGSSLFSTPQAFTLGVGKTAVDISTIPLGARTDYLGWTLERQKGGVSADDPYFVVKNDGTITTHTDGRADADLFDQVDDGIHGEPPHMEGVIHHYGRLMGWDGSTLYVSQAVADLEQTGPFNFHPLAAYVIATDDGDFIRTAIRQGDRLLVCKFGSLHAFEGDSPLSFRPIPVYDGVGAVGPRAATSFGQTAFVFSDRGLHIVRGNKVEPFGWDEAGDYFDGLSLASISEVVLQNWKDELLLITFKNNAGTYETVVYDRRERNWSHFTEWNIRDSIVLRDGGFSNASLVFADPVARKVWAGFDGALDFRDSAGGGGVGVSWKAELPEIDDGEPTVWKDFEDLEVRMNGGTGRIVATIGLGGDRPAQSIAFSYALTSARVQPATQNPLRVGPGSNPAYVYKVGGKRPRPLSIGLPQDTTGKTHSLTFSGTSEDGPSIHGYDMGAIRLPQRTL